jgi:hypothetical protein
MGCPVTVSKTSRITVLQLSAETVQFKVQLKRVLPKVIDDLGERLFDLIFFKNFFTLLWK